MSPPALRRTGLPSRFKDQDLNEVGAFGFHQIETAWRQWRHEGNRSNHLECLCTRQRVHWLELDSLCDALDKSNAFTSGRPPAAAAQVGQ